MKNILLILSILGIFVSCTTFDKIKINIPDNYEEIIIKNEHGGNVYGLFLKIDGKVNGYLEIEFTNGENYSEKHIYKNGKINFIYEGDYYADEFIIKISPYDNATGYINIMYSFKT